MATILGGTHLSHLPVLSKSKGRHSAALAQPRSDACPVVTERRTAYTPPVPEGGSVCSRLPAVNAIRFATRGREDNERCNFRVYETVPTRKADLGPPLLFRCAHTSHGSGQSPCCRTSVRVEDRKSLQPPVIGSSCCHTCSMVRRKKACSRPAFALSMPGLVGMVAIAFPAAKQRHGRQDGPGRRMHVHTVQCAFTTDSSDMGRKEPSRATG